MCSTRGPPTSLGSASRVGVTRGKEHDAVGVLGEQLGALVVPLRQNPPHLHGVVDLLQSVLLPPALLQPTEAIPALQPGIVGDVHHSHNLLALEPREDLALSNLLPRLFLLRLPSLRLGVGGLAPGVSVMEEEAGQVDGLDEGVLQGGGALLNRVEGPGLLVVALGEDGEGGRAGSHGGPT